MIGRWASLAEQGKWKLRNFVKTINQEVVITKKNNSEGNPCLQFKEMSTKSKLLFWNNTHFRETSLLQL